MGEAKLIRIEGIEITIPQLPEDIVANILSRLPVKYLIQLKCVSKPWLSLISDLHFAKLQLSQSKNISCHRCLHFTVPLQTVDLEAFGDGHDHVSHLEYPGVMKKPPDYDRFVEVGGSCNGLICVFCLNGHMFLWNPTIRAALEFTKNVDFDPMDYFICGLGYDFLVDDYKILKARYHRQADDDFLVDDFEILRLKSNVWCKVEEKPKFDYLFEKISQVGIFSRGALHWLVKRTTKIIVVLVFDMLEEKFYEPVELPGSIEETKYYYLYLTNSEDSLFMFCGDFDNHDLEAWKLNKYGVKSSWTKIFSKYGCTIPNFEIRGRVLHYTKTGKIILDYGNSGLVLYDPKENTWKMVTPPQIDLDMLSMSKAWFYQIGIIRRLANA